MTSATPLRRLPSLRGAALMVVVNPHASAVGPGVAARVEAVLARRGVRARTLVTEAASEWIEALDGDLDRRVVLVGGDGTIHDAVNAAADLPELALVPAGTANNVARSVGIPLDAEAAACLAVEGRPRPIDLIRATTPVGRRVVVEGLSVGYLAEARVRYRGENSAAVAAAVEAGAIALARFHPLHVRVRRGGVVDDLELAQLFVANLPRYAFGLHVAPDADLTDGLLDLVAIECRGRRDLLPMLGRLRHAAELRRPEAHHWRAERVRIETHGTSPVVADSYELAPGPVDVSVLPRALALVRP